MTGWANEIPPDDPHRAFVTGVVPKPLDVLRLARLLGAEDAALLGRSRSRA